MAHYAFIKNNVVTEVITGVDETDTNNLPEEFNSWEEFYLTQRPGQDSCKRTSYNTDKNIHSNGSTPFRGNYAGIGFIYNSELDIFLPPKPYESWVIDEANATWIAPVAKPELTQQEIDDLKYYAWNENIVNWELLTVNI
tara:strand:- start:66 stop:485 length:420 start_codon:yes stop_codon:yes gene_type:complete